MLIKDPETGEEKEYFSAEDVDAKVKEVEQKKVEEIQKIQDDFKAKETEGQTALQKLNQEKADLEAKLKGDGTGGQVDNFKTLKEALDKKTEEIANVNKELGEMKESSKKQQRDSLIAKIASKDPELKKKIDLFYEKDLSGMPDSTPEEVLKKVEAAAKLAGENVDMDPLAGAMGGGSRGEGGTRETGAPEFSAREKALGAKLGITDADYKKYGPKIPKK